MPELPEVEAARRLAQRHCAGSTLKAVLATESGGGPRDGQFDDIVIGEGLDAAQLAAALVGRKLATVKRKGKQLWFEMAGSGDHPLFHFGMTGAFVVKGHAPLDFKEFKVHDETWPPRFCKLELVFANGARLAFTDPRRLGRVRLRASPTTEAPISKLAADPVDPTQAPSLAAFTKALRATSAPIKASLLDQERAVSGVGNWVADDALYLAGVHPAAVSKRLGDKQVAAVLEAVKSICSKACEVGADSSRFPPEWLFHVRWGRESKPGTTKALDDGRRVAFSTVAGRTTATVPETQGRTPKYGDQSTADAELEAAEAAWDALGKELDEPATAAKPAKKKAAAKRNRPAAAAVKEEAKPNKQRSQPPQTPTAQAAGDAADEADAGQRAQVRAEILRIATQRGADKTMCPSEVARTVFSTAEWRDRMVFVREVGLELVAQKKIVATQKGQVLADPASAKGPIRYRLRD